MAIKKEQFNLVLNILSKGLNISEACAVAGISRETYYKRLKSDKDFAQSVAVAILEPKVRAINTIQQVGSKDWRASAWWLSRKFPEEFSKKHIIAADDQSYKSEKFRLQ